MTVRGRVGGGASCGAGGGAGGALHLRWLGTAKVLFFRRNIFFPTISNHNIIQVAVYVPHGLVAQQQAAN